MSETEHAAPETHAEPETILTEVIEALVGLAAAVAANGADTFRARYDEAAALGVSQHDLLTVIKAANRVKSQASREMLELADRRLRGEDEEEHGCCGGEGGCGKKEGGCCKGGGGCC
jgi:hypothetical protein